MSSKKLKLLWRFTKTFPVTLFRCQPRAEVELREFQRQQMRNIPIYDFHLKDGFVHPMPGEYFIQPNGISIRPLGKNLKIFFNRFRGGFIYMIKKGTPIPEQLVLLHEFRDHHSLQTSVDCTEK